MKYIYIVALFSVFGTSCKKSSTPANDSYTITVLVKDKDNQAAIAGAKVYFGRYPILSDSAITDANGSASFSFKKETGVKLTFVKKDGYVIPHFSFFPVPLTYEDRTDILYLGKASYVNLTLHKNNAWLPADTILFQVKYDYNTPDVFSSELRGVVTGKADTANRVLNLYSYYNNPGYTKMYFKWDIKRSGSIISSSTDSTDLIQYGTKNFTINY